MICGIWYLNPSKNNCSKWNYPVLRDIVRILKKATLIYFDEKLLSEDHATSSPIFWFDPVQSPPSCPKNELPLSDTDPTSVPVQTWGQSFYCHQLWSTDLLSFPVGPRYLSTRTFSLVNFKILNMNLKYIFKSLSCWILGDGHKGTILCKIFS